MNSPELKKPSHFPISLEERIDLRPIQLADVELIFRAVDVSREQLSPWLPWVEHTRCVEDSKSFLLHVEKEHREGTALHLGIFRKVTEEQETCSGIVGFREIRTLDHCGVLGFWMSSDGRGRGLCTRACSKLIEHGKSIGLRRFEIHCDPSNSRSRAVAERLGFKETEGLICDDFPDPNQHAGYLLDDAHGVEHA